MNKLFFIYLTFQLLSFSYTSQINMFDENGQKHGEWLDNGVNLTYFHGKPTGKVNESGGYAVYDSIGEILQRVTFFQDRPNLIMTEEYFEFGKSKLFKRYKINPSTNKPYLLKQESFKITKKPNGYVDREFNGLQIRYGGLATIYPMGQRVEDTFENGVLIKRIIYYPDGINKLDEISFVPTGIEEYPYVQSIYTMYYKNGQKLIEFDVRHFFDQLTDKGPLNGNLKYEGGTKVNLLNMVGFYCPEMKDYETSVSAFNSFQAGYKSYREPKNFFSKDTLSIPIYSESGTIIKNMVYVKTNLINDYSPNNYALPSTKCKIDTVDFYQYELNGSYKNKNNRIEKYYLGMEDSIWVYEEGQIKIFILFDKGKLVQIEHYQGNIAQQGSYNENGLIEGSHKKYYLKDGTVEEVIYSNGKKVSAPPIRSEAFIPKLKR